MGDVKAAGSTTKGGHECVRVCTFIHAGMINSAAMGLWSTSVVDEVVVVGYIS